MPETDIEWVEIPEGEFQFGFSEPQKQDIRTRLWADYGLDKVDPRTRATIERAILKFRKRGQEHYRYSLSYHLQADEKSVIPGYDDPRIAYFEAETKLEGVADGRRVWLPHYWIARFPITHAQADQFFSSPEGQKWKQHRVSPQNELPKMPKMVEWEVAAAMAAWFGGRLPTVEEWERAARGTDGRLYPWGNEWDPSRGNFDYEYLPEISKQTYKYVSEVDSYPGGVSPFGVWDMAGNLSEWTSTERPPTPRGVTEPSHVVKGLGQKYLLQPHWFWSMTPVEDYGSWRVCLRPVRSAPSG